MRRGNIAGIIVIIIGLSILFSFPFLNILFAILIIWIGVKMIRRRSVDFGDYEGSIGDDEIDKVFIFSPVNKVLTSDNFKSGKIVCIFAGGQIDLSGVKTTKKEIDLEITNVFAGLKIILPKGWCVNSQETNILGGIDDRTQGEKKVTVNLKGSLIFGGMEIVN